MTNIPTPTSSGKNATGRLTIFWKQPVRSQNTSRFVRHMGKDGSTKGSDCVSMLNIGKSVLSSRCIATDSYAKSFHANKKQTNRGDNPWPQNWGTMKLHAAMRRRSLRL